MYGKDQRGENRDYIQPRQGVAKTGASAKDGVAFKEKSQKRSAHYRKKSGGDAQRSIMDYFL